MPDFNYGDFTQQGIENKVTLKARLNERRYVTLDLQSDVEGPNLTISGNAHDELNNIDYPIGSAPNGNIEITENGENINVAPYATATVNVSGGGGTNTILCTVTVVNNTGAEGSAPFQGCRVYENGYINSDFNTIIAANATVIYTLVLIRDADDYYYYGSLTDGMTSLMENCSINTGDLEGDIIPTDPTEPCSFTVTLT